MTATPVQDLWRSAFRTPPWTPSLSYGRWSGSTPRHGCSNLPLVHWTVAYLEEHGARIRLSYDDDGRKANVLASLGPDRVGGVLLFGHTDVVPVDGQDWNSDPFCLTQRGGRLYGRGTADMKGFIACCLAAVPALARTPLKRPIHFALSYDEEAGCLGVPRLDFLIASAPGRALKRRSSEASPQTDEACGFCGSDRRLMTSSGKTSLKDR